MPIDVSRARRETPGCEHVLHFNNAGASLMPQPVLDAVTDYLQLESRMGGYEAEDYMHDQLDHFYDSAAALLGAHRGEIAFCESATRAWDMAFYSLSFRPGDRILMARAEYGSNAIALLQVARRTGARVEVVPSEDSGQLSVAALRDMIDERVKLLAITHVPTNSGLVNPAAEIGQVAHEAGILYLLDACQSFGQMPLNVNAIGCDFLAATGRKFMRGPRGTGLLYVRRALVDQLEPPFLDQHAATWTAPDQYEIRADARRFEAWESNLAGKLGLATAIDYAMAWGLDSIAERVGTLAEGLRQRLAEIPNVTIHDLGVERCGIVTFTIRGHTSDRIRRVLSENRINTSVTRAGSALLDMQARQLDSAVRASVHYYNTEDEIDQLCEALRRYLTAAVSSPL